MNRKWLKWLAIIAVGLLLLVVLGSYGTWALIRSRGIAARDAEVARLDAADSDWQAADLCAARNKTIPPPAENSGERGLKALALVPKSFDEWTKTEKWRGDLKPGVLPQDGDVCELAAVHQDCDEALAVARSIRHLPRGGFKLDFDQRNPIATLLPNTQKMREVASLLAADVIVLGYDGKPNEAIESCHALLNTARSLGDEPTLISCLVRMAILAITKDSIERTLGWGEPTQGLAELQAALAAELAEKRLTYGLRGERAMIFLLAQCIDDGRTGLDSMTGTGTGGGLRNRTASIPVRLYLPEQQATMLRMFGEMIEADKLTGPERKAAFDAVVAQVPPPRGLRTLLVSLLMPAVQKVAQAEDRTQAQLGCTIAAIACERYRQRHGVWPSSLQAIPKDILPRPPTDPYTGRQLLYKITGDGPVIYTTGPDEADDGGKTLDPKAAPGTDVGFQLLHPDRRRQAPPPVVADDLPPEPDQP